MTVVDLILKPRIAVEIGSRRKENRIVFEKRRVAAMAFTDGRERHRLAVVLDIVGKQACGTDDDRVVLANRIAGIGGLEAIVMELRRIVDRSDREAHAARRGRPAGVGNNVVEEGIAPEEGARRDVDEAVVSDRHGDIGIGLDRLDSELVAIDIGVVREQGARIEREARAFGDAPRPYRYERPARH